MSPESMESFLFEAKTGLANHEVRITNLEETVKDIKALTEATNELAITLKNVNEKIDINQKNTNEKIDELSNNVKEIVDAPKKNWVTIRTAIFSSVGGAIGTGIIAWLISILK